jgi:DNA repair protein RecO (recombination protein O)
MKTKDLAICLRAVNYSETSQVVTLLTRDTGKIAAMAKGSRRPKSAFDGAIEPFSYGQVMFAASESHDKLATLTEFVQMPQFRLLRTLLSAMHAGLFALELTEAFCELYDPHPDLFDALAETLRRLQHCDTPPSVLPVLIDYQMAVLTEGGIAPLLDRCTNCSTAVKGMRAEWYFSSAANGLLCPGCEQTFTDKRRISFACAELLSQSIPIEQASEAALAEAEQLLIYHFTELMRRPPRMAKYFVVR